MTTPEEITTATDRIADKVRRVFTREITFAEVVRIHQNRVASTIRQPGPAMSDEAHLPQAYEDAKRSMAQCERVDECKDWADKAMAIAAYARQAADITLLNHALRIQCRSTRRMGELLIQIEPNKGGRPSKTRDTDDPGLSRKSIADDAGIKERQRKTSIRIAKIPEQEFERLVDAEKAPTVSGLIRETQRKETGEKLDELASREITHPSGEFDVVVIDPPWPMNKVEREVRPNQVALDYPTMDEDEIKGIEIPAAENCHVWVWTTHKYLPMALRCIEHWGLKYVCTCIWHKPGGPQPYNLPQYNNEFAIYCRKGTPLFFDTKAFNTCFYAPRGKHSEKPEEFYEVVRRVTKGRRLDMFNRRSIDGFTGWGNESLG